jgi:Tol biopolymer transport system component
MASCGDSTGSNLTDHLVITRPEGLVDRDLASGDERLLILQPDNATLVEPAVSPDGSRIAYVGLLSAIVIPGQSTDLGSDIYVANVDGSEARIAVEHAVRGEQLHTPAWLPDGNLLIYSQRFENRQIVVNIERVDLTTGERTVVVENGFAPAPSPDGRSIAYLRPEPDLTLSLWAADANGQNERRLVPDSGLISFNRPRYSLDGRYLVVGAAGSGELVRARRMPESLSLNAVGLSMRRAAALNGLPEDIWLIDVQTDEARRLADLDLDQPTAVFSGDGQRIFAFGDKGLYYIIPQGGEERLADGMFHGQIDWLSAGVDH